MSRVVLDASALLALILREPGSAQVADHVGGAIMSAVNLAEVISRLTQLGWGSDPAHKAARSYFIQVEPFDEGQAVQVGALRARTREQGLSLGDRACLALAERDGSALFTSDAAFARVQTNARVQLIR